MALSRAGGKTYQERSPAVRIAIHQVGRQMLGSIAVIGQSGKHIDELEQRGARCPASACNKRPADTVAASSSALMSDESASIANFPVVMAILAGGWEARLPDDLFILLRCLRDATDAQLGVKSFDPSTTESTIQLWPDIPNGPTSSTARGVRMPSVARFLQN
jgi:hypothetical protein